MADGTSASDRLGRLLHILPAASREEGVALETLARDLDVDRSTILSDLTEVTARSYYHPAGSGDDIQIRLESDRVSVWTTGAFRRPVKLSPLEVFCLALGLRQPEGRRTAGGDGTAYSGGTAGASEVEELLGRVEAHLASGEIPDGPPEAVHATAAAPDPDGVRELVVTAARECIVCRIRYLKPGDLEPEDRLVHPHVVVHAEGRWYVVGWCETSGGGRAFRLDRIVDARLTSREFDPAADEVDVEAFLQGGRVYHAHRETEVVVRYSPVVARWVAEWAPEPDSGQDGSLTVRHRVADPEWMVRHVLTYAGEAEVVEPEEVRRMVAAALA